MITTTAVHPHVRGEHIPADDKMVLKAGSSPRTWGTLGHI
ncbi:conserved hypothetical protein [uncultured Desulfobacterium sp.]|uniref:Uncharacterized protein n=1 Tax=uncultured Desulfobacterium sp. TaxID=201089 RepID=A0A445MT28_9BACT|nr:conserved hypothetical protein [uncultured Desulfobacterium sp.]